ncbi:MAG: FAD:protein FMN transferase [Pseudomonas sp.]|nr:FAD:protein FMN transferase [Pseudomonas sp.]
MTSAARVLLRVLQPAIAVALAAAIAGCFNSTASVSEVSGATMGSTYSVKWVPTDGSPTPESLQASIEGELDEFDAQVSTWREDSDLSRFNALPAGTCQTMPRPVLDMVNLAQTLSTASEGQFDITVSPLLDVWGFHRGDGVQVVPDQSSIDKALQKVGQQSLWIEDDKLCKERAVEVDLSSLAAGYMVDRVAERLVSLGITDYMIEMTGELKAAGVKPGGMPWRIAIEEPRDDERMASLIVELDGYAISTSGDYRNYFEYDGKRYSHTVDPLTGWPVMHGLTAVTVMDPSTLMADGLSTLLLVLGPEKGWQYAQDNNVAALFVLREGAEFVSRPTPLFAALTKSEE